MENKQNNIEFAGENFFPEDFLQSSEWAKFQEKAGKKTHLIKNEHFSASIIEHILPIVGKYFYCPRGPILHSHQPASSLGGSSACLPARQVISHQMKEMIDLAKKNNAGWIRIDPVDNQILECIKESISEKIFRAPHDMQPKEIFVIDLKKTPEQLLGEMKPKTRYNIGVAKKKHVVIKSSSDKDSSEEKNNYTEAFLKLTKEMAARHGISTHSEQYYRKMIASFPDDMLKIYVAEYDEKIIAANLMLFYGKTAIYLHGASGNEHRNVMAPFLLQWQAILDAKERGFESYDFGGVQTPGAKHQKHSDLVGVTNFKLGFSPHTKPIEFPGSYDIIINHRAYALYRGLQRAKAMVGRFRR